MPGVTLFVRGGFLREGVFVRFFDVIFDRLGAGSGGAATDDFAPFESPVAPSSP